MTRAANSRAKAPAASPATAVSRYFRIRGSIASLFPPGWLATHYKDSSRRFLSHRALAALRADSDLSLGVVFAARALPPLLPPSLPKSRAASLFSSSVTQ